MRTIETTVYKYEELSDEAKEKARDWWRQCENESGTNDFAEFVIEDAAQVAILMGIDLCQTRVDLMGSGYRYKPTIYYSGFYCQGDGACYVGEYRFSENAHAKVVNYAPNDTELHAIAATLDEIQGRYGNSVWASTKHSGHYSHSGCMSIDVGSDHYNEDDEEIELTVDDEDALKQALREFADWIYLRLKNEYEYIMSDENVAESIVSSENEFTEDGKLFF